MIRLRLLGGFLLMMLGGMAFAGLRLAPPEEQPFVSPLVLAAAVVGGLAQFAWAVLSVTSVPPMRLNRIVTGAHGIALVLLIVPLVSAGASIASGAVHLGGAVTVAVALVISSALLGLFRSGRRAG